MRDNHLPTCKDESDAASYKNICMALHYLLCMFQLRNKKLNLLLHHWDFLRVESTKGNFTPKLLTEPYVTVSRHTALDHVFVARSKYQCANRLGFSFFINPNLYSAFLVLIRYFDFIHFTSLDWNVLHR